MLNRKVIGILCSQEFHFNNIGKKKKKKRHPINLGSAIFRKELNTPKITEQLLLTGRFSFIFINQILEKEQQITALCF